jgi:ParB/RepB/Spo0J family partition protein
MLNREDSNLENMISQHPTRKNILLGDIHVLPQMRKTFHKEDLELFAENIMILGLLNDIIVNKKKDHTKVNLIAGERRLRAFYLLKDLYGKRFSRIPAKVYHNLTKNQHDALQFAENSYVPVESAEAAEGYAQFFEYTKERYESRGKTLTKAMFARIVNRSDSTIADAFKFVNLPENIKRLAKKEDKRIRLKYGAAIELARIKDSEQRWLYAQKAVYLGWNAEQVKKEIYQTLAKQNGQIDLLKYELQTEDLKRNIIADIGKETHQKVIDAYAYIQKILLLSDRKNEVDPLRLESVVDMISNLNKVTGSVLEYATRVPKTEDRYNGPRLKIVLPGANV